MPQSNKKSKKGNAGSYSTALTIPRGPGPIIPEAAVCKLPFAYTTSLFNDSTTAWTVGTPINVRVNNAFSPIQATHQPYGWDQMAALYRYYKVIGCTMKFTVINYNSSPNAAVLVVRPVPVNENFSMSTIDLSTCLEKPATRYVATVAGAGTPPTITLNVDIPKLLGVTPDQFRADNSIYSAATTAAPSSYAYVQVGVAGQGITAFAYVITEVMYTIQYWQRITQTQS